MVTKEQLVCTVEQAKKIKSVLGEKSSIFAYYTFTDPYGKGFVLEDNYSKGIPAFTTQELLELIPKMNAWQSFWFNLRTQFKPVKVADYVINKLS